MTVIDQAKEFVSEERHRIKLHDLVASETREVLSLTTEEHFSIQGNWSAEEFANRLARYEEATTNICSIEMLVAYWGSSTHQRTLTLPVKRISEGLISESGLRAWLALRWYPVLLLLYSGGIAAVAAGRYDHLRALMQANISDPDRSYGRITIIRALTKALSNTDEVFKKLPGHERHHVPRSEYLFKFFYPTLDNLLFLGPEYEAHFDRFEVLLGLEHAEQYASDGHGRVWGPIGRFGWKYRQGEDSSPFHRVISEAESLGDSWPPVKAGLFRGSIDRFREVSTEFSKTVVTLPWH